MLLNGSIEGVVTNSTYVSFLSQSMEELKNTQALFHAQHVDNQQKHESDHEEFRKAQERVNQDHTAKDTEQDNRREDMRTVIEAQIREQVLQTFESAIQDWNLNLSTNIAAAI